MAVYAYGRSGSRKYPHFAAPSSHKGGGFSPFGLVNNLIGDVRDAAVGFFPGLYHLVKDPIKTADSVARLEWQTWSPLFEGHLGKFGKQLYAHPLGPILDVAAVFSGGASLAGKTAKFATKAEWSAATRATKTGVMTADDVAGLSRGARLGLPRDVPVRRPSGKQYEGMPEVAGYRHLRANPLRRSEQEAAYAFTSKLGEHLPDWTGARRFTPEGRYERLVMKDRALHLHAARTAISAQIAAFMKGGKDIAETPNEIAALVDVNARGSLMTFAGRASKQELVKTRRRRKVAEPVNTEAKPWQIDQKVPAGRPGTKTTTTYAPAKSYSFIMKDEPKVPSHIETSEQYLAYLKTVPKRHTTKDISKALTDEEGKYYLVPDHSVSAFAEEALNSSKVLTALYSKPTTVWKYLILAQAPRYFVNNAVGNYLMYAMATGPGAVRGFVDAQRQLHGERATVKSLEGAQSVLAKHLGPDNSPVSKYLGGSWKQGFTREVFEGGKLSDIAMPGTGRTAAVVRTAKSGLYVPTHKVAEDFVRTMSSHAQLRRAPEVQALMRGGMKYKQAIGKVLQDPGFRSRIMEGVDNTLGQYYYLNPVERAVRAIVPFYTWDRAIMRHGIHLVEDRPATAMAAAALGRENGEELKQFFGGEVPDFLMNLIHLGTDKDGRMRVLTTGGLNPYATIPNVVESAGALVGLSKMKPSEALSQQLNPFVTGAIEATTGQSLLSGAQLPKTRGGIIGSILTRTATQLPQAKLATTLVKGTPQSKSGRPFVFRKDADQEALAFLGIPLKGLNLEAAKRMQAQRSPSGKRRRKKKAHY